MVAIGGVAILGDLHHIETEFGANVSFGIVLVRNLVAVFCAQIGKQKANGLVHRGMSHIVGRVVGESAESEGVFVQVAGFMNEVDDEITAAHVMRQIAEVFIAKRVVAHVLHQAATVSEGVGLLQIIRSGIGETLQQKRLDGVFPKEVDDFFMGQNGVGTAYAA